MVTVGRYDVGPTHAAWGQENDERDKRNGTRIYARRRWHITTGIPWHTTAIDVVGFDVVVVVVEPSVDIAACAIASLLSLAFLDGILADGGPCIGTPASFDLLQ